MTQSNLLELAKQGDEEAIASVINYFLKDKGITAKAAYKDDSLLVLLKAAQVPDQQSTVAFIHKLMMKLKIDSIKSVKVYGKQTGQSSPAWSETLDLTPKTEEPKKQAESSESPSQEKLKAISNHWPAWFPYPSSWLRTFALVLWMGVILRIAGFWSLALGGALAVITSHLELLLLFLGLGLLVSVLMFSYLHHFLIGNKSLPRSSRWLPSSRSLWEGFYAPIVMLLAFGVTLLTLVPFLIPNCSYATATQINYCLELTGRELVKYEYRMAQIGSVIWFVSAVYLYQAEYLIRNHLASKMNVALENDRSGINPSGKTPGKLAKQLLIILLVPLTAVGIYLFSKLPEVQETISLLVPSQSPSSVQPKPSSAISTPSPTTSPTPSAASTPSPTASPSPSAASTPSSTASPASLPQSDPFREAVNKAMSAATTAQTAKSKDEWNLVASQWQEAIALMQAVPSSHPKFTVAQEKAVEYQSKLEYAQKNAANVQ